MAHQLFALGRIMVTRDAQQSLTEIGLDPGILLDRHVSGDFGDLSAEDLEANMKALSGDEPGRIVSIYKSPIVVFSVVTESDRSATTILLPEEY